MTRKDYVAIAEAMHNNKPKDTTEENVRVQWATDCMYLADMLEKDNSRFDRKRFLYACYGKLYVRV